MGLFSREDRQVGPNSAAVYVRHLCETCHDEKLVAFSCKRRGFCPSCGARRMADSAALLVDEILPYQLMRQWVLSFPFPLRCTHVVFEPLDFMYRMYGMPRAQECAGAAISRLVALVPKPRVHLTRYHGDFAPHSKYRARVTPTKQGNRKKIQLPDMSDQAPAEKRASKTWAKRLKRVFDIDIKTCEKCGGNVKIIASIRLQGCRR